MNMKTTTLEESANILKLLGDKTRLSILGLLQMKTFCVCELVDIFKMTQPAISQHLRKLKDAGLVKEQRKGQWIHYSLNRNSDYFQLVEDILRHIPSQDDKLNILKQQSSKMTCK
ncbi:ArsR family transcriptional regulator [Bacillus sp. X1(2014)]|nr:ArsR family transcriptional regulator [Bacillus sp. X1(2014)]